MFTMDDLVERTYKWFDDRDLHDPTMQMLKVYEEVGELSHEVCRGHYDTPECIDALGDSLVTIIGMCHHLGVHPTRALATALNEIEGRKGKVVHGNFIKDNE